MRLGLKRSAFQSMIAAFRRHRRNVTHAIRRARRTRGTPRSIEAGTGAAA